MKKLIIIGIIALGLFASRIIQAQGTMTYLSNLEQPSVGSRAVGSDSWLAATFSTGNNANGYVLNSVQLAMTDASDDPSGFTVMIYGLSGDIFAPLPGSSIGTLNGSTDPATTGTYTYTAPSNLMLSPNTFYFIVLTAGTAIANGAYDWSLAGIDSYNPNGHWGVIHGVSSGVYDSTDGSTWNSISGAYPQFAINATAVPEPGILSLFGLGGLGFLRHRRKAKAA